MEDIQEKNEILSKDSSQDELFAALQHTQADLENCRKGMRAQFYEGEKGGVIRVVRAIIPTYNALMRAVALAGQDPAFRQGAELVLTSFEQGLAQVGVVRIPAVGQLYDPKFHEVVEEVPAKDVPSWSILEEVESGWLIQSSGEVICPVKVIIAQ